MSTEGMNEGLGGLRNRAAQRIANFALNHVATPEYRRMIDGTIRYGLRSAAVDTALGARLVFDHVKGEVRRERT